MKKLFDILALDHVVIALVSLLAALLTSRNDVGVPIIPKTLNTLSGFSSACISGYILYEYGWAVWASCGVSYLLGHIGNRLMNALLVIAKRAEIDPFSTAGKVIDLIWRFKLPVKNEPESNP